jgi:hypothetical protein
VEAAIAQLKAALAKHPADGDIIAALAQFHDERGDSAQASRYRDQLRAVTKRH